MLCTKMRDYIKAVNRTMRDVDCADLVGCEFVETV
jgi:hypothetical protein